MCVCVCVLCFCVRACVRAVVVCVCVCQCVCVVTMWIISHYGPCVLLPMAYLCQKYIVTQSWSVTLYDNDNYVT